MSAIGWGCLGVGACLLLFAVYCAFVRSSQISREEEAEEDGALEGINECSMGHRPHG
jgi:hypothetical protein